MNRLPLISLLVVAGTALSLVPACADSRGDGGRGAPTPLDVASRVRSINDATQGAGENQFEFVGRWGGYPNGGMDVGCYQDDNHWAYDDGDHYNVRFTGTRIQVYSQKGPDLGVFMTAVDGVAGSDGDEYSATHLKDVLVWDSGVLTNGPHVLTVTYAARHNPNSSAIRCNFGNVPAFAGMNCVPAGYVLPLPTNGLLSQWISSFVCNKRFTAMKESFTSWLSR